jgi:hypothetical protein
LNIPGTATRNSVAQPPGIQQHSHQIIPVQWNPDYNYVTESGILPHVSYFISSSSSVLLSLLLDSSVLPPFCPSALLSRHKILFRLSCHKNSVPTLQCRKSTPNILTSDSSKTCLTSCFTFKLSPVAYIRHSRTVQF